MYGFLPAYICSCKVYETCAWFMQAYICNCKLYETCEWFVLAYICNCKLYETFVWLVLAYIYRNVCQHTFICNCKMYETCEWFVPSYIFTENCVQLVFKLFLNKMDLLFCSIKNMTKKSWGWARVCKAQFKLGLAMPTGWVSCLAKLPT